jgi:ligand-binding sensor domain-containing protein/signal transduction histidine kinase
MLSKIIFCFFALIPVFCFALNPDRTITQYVYRTWDMDDGLPSTTIYAIVQTRDGYLWIATSNGLARFDGVSFTVFDTTNTKEIQFSEMMSLLEASDGTLWIGCYWGGLISYKDGKFHKYGKQDGLSDERVVHVYQDKAGNLWIGTPNGLFQMKDGKFKKFWKEEGLPGNVVWSALEDRSGTFWVGTVGGGLYQFRNGRFLKFKGIEEKDIFCLLQDRNGDIWVGTDSALYRIRNNKVTTYSAPKDLAGDGAPMLLQDHDENLWIGTDRGLTRFRNEVFQSFTPQQGFIGNQVPALCEDREGNLWIGTADRGLARLSNGKFVTFSKSEGLEDDDVTSLFENKNGDILIGTRSGMSRLRNNQIENFLLAPLSSHRGVRSVIEDSKGTTWIGSAGFGLHVLENDKIVPFSKTETLLGDSVRAMYEDDSGSIWIGNFGQGVNRLENGKIKEKFTVKEGLSTSYVSNFHRARDGSLLISTEDGGINRYKDGKFSVHISQQLLEHQVITMYIDGDNVLWMGTLGGGLKRFQNGKLISIRRIHGLYEDMVGDILEDSKNNFWISTPKGIFKVNKKDLNDFASGKISSVRSTAYGKSDGMKSLEFACGNQPAAMKSRNGKFWFPSAKGVVMIDPERLETNTIPPTVHIQQILVDGQKLNLKSSEKAELSPGKEKFEFHYTALSLVAPEKVLFKYKLEGFDKNWVDAGIRRTAYYTNIPPGNYVFRVIASNNDGVWNESGTNTSFYLKPYFYQTPWFYLLCGVMVVLVAVGFHRQRIKKVSAEFKAVIEERTRIAREIHDGLAQAVAGVVLQLETAQSSTKEKSQRHLDRALELARQSVQDVRHAIGDLRPPALGPADFPEAVRSMIHQQLQDANLTLQFDVTGNPVSLSEKIQTELFRICQESVQNVIKHSKAQTVSVKINYGPASLNLLVGDDGCGFDMNSGSIDGHYGLAGIRERAIHIGAECFIRSTPEQGTLVQVNLQNLN